MKYYQNTSTVKNPWEEVMVAFWLRYPNPFSKHVLSEDTIYRRVTEAQISSIRVISKTNRMPKWGERLVGHIRDVIVIEESLVDLVNRTFTTVTRNVGYQKIMSIKEKCTYEPDPSDPQSFTLVRREAWIDSGLKGVGSILTRFGVERFKSNAGGATKGLTFVLQKLFPHRHNDESLKSTLSAKIDAAFPHRNTDETLKSSLSAKIDATSAKLMEKVNNSQSGDGEML